MELEKKNGIGWVRSPVIGLERSPIRRSNWLDQYFY